MATTILDGAKELLLDATTAIETAGISDYIVIGGWCPYLRNRSKLTHPGTLDVDILFKEGHRAGALDSAIKSLRRKGFVASAKHSFQLLIGKTINGESLIYNVDLLHPRMSETDKGLFVDHLGLDIPFDGQGRRLKTFTSIALPCSGVLFEESLFSPFTLTGTKFNLVDFTGMLITKMDSCQKVKRERDSFDLYVALKSDGIDFKKLRRLSAANERIRMSLDGLLKYLSTDAETFDENVAQFSDVDESPANVLSNALHANI